MKCSLPPHKETLTFTSYGDYEAHYNKAHSNRCLECRKNFPSEHLLSVHFEDCHDPLAVIRREKGEHTYSCFVEGCERKCLTPPKRRMHMIDKHMYPKNYFFAVTEKGIDGRTSLLSGGGHGRRRSSASVQNKGPGRRESLQSASSQRGQEDTREAKAPESEGNGDERPDAAMDDLTGAMSSLQFVPPSIRFGRGRKGFAKR